MILKTGFRIRKSGVGIPPTPMQVQTDSYRSSPLPFFRHQSGDRSNYPILRMYRTWIAGMSALLFLSVTPVRAELDSAQLRLIDTIGLQLRSDYRLCTGDSSEVSDARLIRWHTSIDSIISQSDFPAIAKNFFRETGMSPANVRPCEIVRWLQDFEHSMQEYSVTLDKAKDTVLQRRNDSLHLAAELAKSPSAPYDLLRIPFGISLRAFNLIMQKHHIGNVTRTPDFIRYDAVPYGRNTFRVAFHFSDDSTYTSYEIESNSCGFDSLNAAARPIMLSMAAQFESVTGSAPDHIYRVGQFDIVPGRLSICKLWTFPAATAYFGLARNKNRFYAKAIVSGTGK